MNFEYVTLSERRHRKSCHHMIHMKGAEEKNHQTQETNGCQGLEEGRNGEWPLIRIIYFGGDENVMVA